MQDSLYDATSSPKQAAVEIYKGILDGNSEIRQIKSDLVDTIEFVSSTKDQGGLSALMNCTIVRREVKMLLGTGCYQLGVNFTYQSLLLGLMGPLFTLMAFCMCCSVIRSQQKRTTKDTTIKRYL